MKFTIYTEKIYYKGKEITNQKEIAYIIRNHILHLGDIEISYLSKPKKWWKKIFWYLCSSKY